MAILTIGKLQEIKPMSQNNLPLIGQLIDEVEFGKIQRLLGTCVYNKIVDEIKSHNISQELQEILDNGLYKCITYFVYARYIQESMLVDTFTGMVIKDRTDSSTAPTGTIKNIVNEYVDMALMAFDLVKCQIQEKYGTTEETVKTGFSEIIGVRRGTRNKRVSYVSNYFGK